MSHEFELVFLKSCSTILDQNIATLFVSRSGRGGWTGPVHWAYDVDSCPLLIREVQPEQPM